MSVKELKLIGTDAILHFKHGTNTEKFGIAINDKESKVVMMLDRNQAYLLYLYLQEHLGYNAVPTIPKEYWECKCGKFHQKDYICTMLK